MVPSIDPPIQPLVFTEHHVASGNELPSRQRHTVTFANLPGIEIQRGLSDGTPPSSPAVIPTTPVHTAAKQRVPVTPRSIHRVRAISSGLTPHAGHHSHKRHKLTSTSKRASDVWTFYQCTLEKNECIFCE